MVIFVAGTGNPYFSTDTAAALRAMEIHASLLCKATKVEGVYDRDPAKYSDASMFRQVSYDRFIRERIGVMDATAVTLCRDNQLPIRVFALGAKGNIKRVTEGETDRYARDRDRGHAQRSGELTAAAAAATGGNHGRGNARRS